VTYFLFTAPSNQLSRKDHKQYNSTVYSTSVAMPHSIIHRVAADW